VDLAQLGLNKREQQQQQNENQEGNQGLHGKWPVLKQYCVVHVPGDLSATKHIESLLFNINSQVMIKQQARSAHSRRVISY